MKVTFCGGSHYVASALLHLDQPAEGGGGRDLQLIHNPLLFLRFAQICWFRNNPGFYSDLINFSTLHYFLFFSPEPSFTGFIEVFIWLVLFSVKTDSHLCPHLTRAHFASKPPNPHTATTCLLSGVSLHKRGNGATAIKLSRFNTITIVLLSCLLSIQLLASAKSLSCVG